ncbi:hypothetical protein ACP4OV_028331 [Aristida adscensionis]
MMASPAEEEEEAAAAASVPPRVVKKVPALRPLPPAPRLEDEDKEENGKGKGKEIEEEEKDEDTGRELSDVKDEMWAICHEEEASSLDPEATGCLGIGAKMTYGGEIRVLFETPSGFAIFRYDGVQLYLPDAIQNVWADFFAEDVAEQAVKLKCFQTFEDKASAINCDTGVSEKFAEMIKCWVKPRQMLAVGKREYKDIIEEKLGIHCIFNDEVMELIWGLKNLMKVLGPFGLKDWHRIFGGMRFLRIFFLYALWFIGKMPGSTKRAKWSHQMKLFLIELLKDHDVPGFRTQNAWSKEAWTNIVCRLNAKFGVSFSLSQVKQKEQDLKKDYRSVKDLLAESGFGWDSQRMMVDAPENVWASFAARKNNESALQWREKSFPYFDAYRYAEGRTRHGMDHYASKSKNAVTNSTQPAHVADTYHSPSPTLHAMGESGSQFPFEEEIEEGNFDLFQHSSPPVQHMHVPASSTPLPAEVPESRRGKKQKNRLASTDDGFHERYLKLKKEEIDRFAAIEEKKLEDPYSINKCIALLEALEGLQLGDILMAADIFKCKDNREVFLSFSTDALRFAWITREIGRKQAEHQS